LRKYALLPLLATLLWDTASGASRLTPSQKRALELSPAVVLIQVTFNLNVRFRARNSPYSFDIGYTTTGTGFLYRPDGYIITNGHVVADANIKDITAQRTLANRLNKDIVESAVAKYVSLTGERPGGNIDQIKNALGIDARFTRGPDLTVYLSNKSSYNGEIKAYSDPIGDGGKDIAIIKIDGTNLPTVRLGDSSKVALQDTMMVIGYPSAASGLGMSVIGSVFVPTVTNGHVSAMKTDFKGTEVIQSDAAITHGNSGGPAFNDAGEAIGVATFGPKDVAGFNFFVPINTAMEFVNQVGVKPESSLFNKLWATALDTYDAGQCQTAKTQLQSVLNIMPNNPDALRLMQASEKCASEEGAVGRTMEGSTWLIASIAGIVILTTGFLLMRRKAAPRPAPAAAVMTGAPPLGATKPDLAPRAEIPHPPSETSFGNIQVTAGSLAGQKFKITKAGLLVGTDKTKCQVCVSEDSISHEHAWIVPVDNRVVVIDRGSTNGTYINSVDSPRVSKVGLQNGDRIYLGRKGSVVLTYFSS